ncbi:unnamed protein product, partial [Didymodactylos carnosus]
SVSCVSSRRVLLICVAIIVLLEMAHPTDQVSVNVMRKSDGKKLEFILPETTTIRELKNDLKHRLTPQFVPGCRLIFRDEVLKGKHTLKHYGIKVGVDDQDILMDDSREWRSSSSSDSEVEKH